MMEKIINLLKNNNMTIPRILFTQYKQLKLSDQELVVIIYLFNECDLIYNPKKISDDLNLDVKEVLEIISNLVTKDIISIKVIKDSNVRNEYISLENLYKKLAFSIINDEEKDEEPSNIFDIFEKEFGRTLSPIEYELINAWKDNNISEELIVLALKEAVFNGVSNLRYIDRILFEWQKKGIKTAKEVDKERVNYKNKKSEKKEMFDYDWLNDDNK